MNNNSINNYNSGNSLSNNNNNCLVNYNIHSQNISNNPYTEGN